MTTVLLELAGLAVYGVVTLVGWLFGSAPDPHLAAFTATVAAAGPAIELYREGRPPRRLAVVALLTLAGLSLLGAAATSWALPPAADPGLGLLVGYLVAMPAGVAVLARFLGGEEPT